MKRYCFTLQIALTLSLLFVSCSESSKVENSDLTVCERYDEIDLKMLNTIKQITAEYQGDEKFLDAFKDAQIYWIQYRNRQIKAVFPLQPKDYDYDVGACKCELYSELTTIRINELERWLQGVPAEENCAGSFKVLN